MQCLLRECERSSLGKTNISLLCRLNGLNFLKGWVGQFGDELYEATALLVETNLDVGPDDRVEVQLTEESGAAITKYMSEIADRDESQSNDAAGPSAVKGEARSSLDAADSSFALGISEIEDVPASDRTVPLDHNSPAYSEVVENLEELKRAIESNNEYRETDVEDHDRRLTDVESTLKLLENKRVNVNAMKAVAFGSLVYLAEKFAEHPIGELAKAAWDGLKALLGIG